MEFNLGLSKVSVLSGCIICRILQLAAMMEVRELSTSASIWLHITHYHTFPSCLQAGPSHWPVVCHVASHWLSSAGSLLSDSSESEIPGAGREAREERYAGKVMADVESWAGDAMLGPRTSRYHPHCPVSLSPVSLPSAVLSQ